MTTVHLVVDALASVAASACPAALVVLDLDGVTACDQPALVALEDAASMLADAGKELALHGAPEGVVQLITESGVAAGLERH